MGEGGQSDELRDFIEEIKEDNPELHAAYAVEIAANAKSLSDVSTDRVENPAQK